MFLLFPCTNSMIWSYPCKDYLANVVMITFRDYFNMIVFVTQIFVYVERKLCVIAFVLQSERDDQWSWESYL
jgi:hypothetical protein